MIVVRMELWPGGDQTKARPLGVITIVNDGTGTVEEGNYDVAASHAGKFFGKRREPYKEGRVLGFIRGWSPYKLLYRALKALGEVG